MLPQRHLPKMAGVECGVALDGNVRRTRDESHGLARLRAQQPRAQLVVAHDRIVHVKCGAHAQQAQLVDQRSCIVHNPHVNRLLNGVCERLAPHRGVHRELEAEAQHHAELGTANRARIMPMAVRRRPRGDRRAEMPRYHTGVPFAIVCVPAARDPAHECDVRTCRWHAEWGSAWASIETGGKRRGEGAGR